MGKHSKQAHTQGYFTSGERAKLIGKVGTLRQRLGEESQRRFDQCNLCLQRLSDPVATPSGFLFCRACIFESLVSQKQALDAQRAAYNAEQSELAAEAAAAKSAPEFAAVARFEQRESGVGAGSSDLFRVGGAASHGAGLSAVVDKLKDKTDHRDMTEIRSEISKASFWIPESTPVARTGKVPVPDPAPRDPISGAFLRAKQLISLHLTRIPPAEGEAEGGAADAASSADAADAGAEEARSRFMCPSCMRAVVYQRMHVASGCGHVTCEKCTKDFVLTSLKCLVCNAAVKPEGVVALQQGGSAFAGHAGSQAESRRFTVTVMPT